MPRTETEAVEPKLIRLYAGDFERLAALYPHVSTARVIRNIVRSHLVRAEAKAGVKKYVPGPVDLGGLIDE